MSNDHKMFPKSTYETKLYRVNASENTLSVIAKLSQLKAN